MRFYQLWHSRTHQSQSHAWLRSLLLTVARTADATQSLQQPRATTAQRRLAAQGKTRRVRVNRTAEKVKKHGLIAFLGIKSAFYPINTGASSY